eukprot:7496279-Lingulodinium_polyedra.AAC.1
MGFCCISASRVSPLCAAPHRALPLPALHCFAPRNDPPSHVPLRCVFARQRCVWPRRAALRCAAAYWAERYRAVPRCNAVRPAGFGPPPAPDRRDVVFSVARVSASRVLVPAFLRVAFYMV